MPQASAQSPREGHRWLATAVACSSAACVASFNSSDGPCCRRVPPSGRLRAGTPQHAHRRKRRLPPMTGAALASALSFRSRSWPSDGLGLHGTRFWRASLRSDSERVACGWLPTGFTLHTRIQQLGVHQNFETEYVACQAGNLLVCLLCKADKHFLRRSSGQVLPLQHPSRRRHGPLPWQGVTWSPSPRQVRSCVHDAYQ